MKKLLFGGIFLVLTIAVPVYAQEKNNDAEEIGKTLGEIHQLLYGAQQSDQSLELVTTHYFLNEQEYENKMLNGIERMVAENISIAKKLAQKTLGCQNIKSSLKVIFSETNSPPVTVRSISTCAE